ncbi:alpha-N-arabinofuranosidase [Mucilaginibacter sp. X5P1]|uniref:alpha-N-arabinofuranosidase n=1 Tax=Mucilaginibacter sp. X5P1 TaxID=2723088 RepID=UPI001622E725|nr:alpha-L-arabinofuranosidase C-terminal domain-containing protein [Mucilaginibacter sp. X5P1]MBB6137505.1 alpha-N-arabinofuranosidase [Mucilaginibacter sp. X5P1]
MKLRACFLSILFVSAGLTSQAQTNISVSVSDKAEPTISKYIYSNFAEHLGRGIYDGFYVGDTSKIPNTNGVRNDVIDALKKMKIPALRWPGGCFADTYHWKDGIGDKTKRPSIVNKWWGGVTEDNSFGTKEFLNMCEAIGTDPYISGNVGSGTVQELSDWVAYTTSDNKNPMSDLRKTTGRDKAWKVAFWGIGNEAWGCGGNMTPEYYANEFKKYSTFMSSGSGKLFRIASGANSDDYHWTDVLMKNIPQGLIEGIALHHYAIIDWDHKGPAIKFTEDQYFKTMKSALLMDTLVTKHSAIMDKYDPQKKIALVVDEWGGWYDVEPGTNPGFLYQQNSMRDAMIAGATLNIFNNHCDRVRMANLAQCINVLQAVILTQGDKIILTPTYHVMEMYNVHQDATLVPVTVSSDDYVFGSEKLSAISASASKDKNGVVHISLVNIDPNKNHKVSLNLDGKKFTVVKGRILASAKVQDYNSFDEPNKIEPKEFNGAVVKSNNISVSMPPASVIVLALN